MVMFRATILILFLSVILLSCATPRIALPTDNVDELLGTWVNTEYEKFGKHSKMVWKADGTASFFLRATYDRSEFEEDWIVKEKWKDANGAISLVVFFEVLGFQGKM